MKKRGNANLNQSKTRTLGPIDARVGATVRRLRQARGMTQKELAARLDLSAHQIQKYEKGMNRMGAGVLYRIAVCFDVPVEILFADVEEPFALRAPSPRGAFDDLTAQIQRIDDRELRGALRRLVKRLSAPAGVPAGGRGRRGARRCRRKA